MKSITTGALLVAVSLGVIGCAYNHGGSVGLWVSPAYEPPPYRVVNFWTVSNLLVRVMKDDEGKPWLHLKTHDGVLRERRIGMDAAIVKYPELSLAFSTNEDRRSMMIACVSRVIWFHSPSTPQSCPLRGFPIMCRMEVYDWSVTVLDGGSTERYNVKQCGVLLATGLGEKELIRIFPELSDIPETFKSWRGKQDRHNNAQEATR